MVIKVPGSKSPALERGCVFKSGHGPSNMAAVAVAMIRKRDADTFQQNDGLGGPAARNALRQASDAVHVLDDKKGPKWADVRKRLEDKGVDVTISDEREMEMRDILATPEYQPLFTRIQETIRQNVLCIARTPRSPTETGGI